MKGERETTSTQAMSSTKASSSFTTVDLCNRALGVFFSPSVHPKKHVVITLFIPTNIVRYFRVLSTLSTSLSATYTVYILLSDVYTMYIIVKRLHCLYVIARCSKSSSTLTSKVACRTKCYLHSPVLVLTN